MCFPFLFLLLLVAFLDATGFFYLSRVSLSAVVIGFHSKLYCGFPFALGHKSIGSKKTYCTVPLHSKWRQYRYTFFMDSSYFYVALFVSVFHIIFYMLYVIIIKAIGFLTCISVCNTRFSGDSCFFLFCCIAICNIACDIYE